MEFDGIFSKFALTNKVLSLIIKGLRESY